MAGLRFSLTTPQVALSAGTAKTVLQIVAPANQRVILESLFVGFDGVSNTAVPILVELLTQTTAGTMTSLTPVKLISSDSETIQTSAQHTASAEPTAGNKLFQITVHPQSPNASIPIPQLIQYPIVGGTRLALRLTAAAGVNAYVTAWCQE